MLLFTYCQVCQCKKGDIPSEQCVKLIVCLQTPGLFFCKSIIEFKSCFKQLYSYTWRLENKVSVESIL